MVDNINIVKELITFQSNDDFYYLQILQRKKENPQIGSNSIAIKSYYINSTQYLDKKYDEIKNICNTLNVRAMLRLNKRSYSKIALKSIQILANSIATNQTQTLYKTYDKACGLIHNDNNKKWIIDVDGNIEKQYIENIVNSINQCKPIENKIITQIPTKNGIHIITKPFNLIQFKNQYPNIDVHKDNPINLYIP